MTAAEKQVLWKLHPEIWDLFVEFNGILQEDDEVWGRLVDRATEIGRRHNSETVNRLLQETLLELDVISRRRKNG